MYLMHITTCIVTCMYNYNDTDHRESKNVLATFTFTSQYEVYMSSFSHQTVFVSSSPANTCMYMYTKVQGALCENVA